MVSHVLLTFLFQLPIPNLIGPAFNVTYVQSDQPVAGIQFHVFSKGRLHLKIDPRLAGKKLLECTSDLQENTPPTYQDQRCVVYSQTDILTITPGPIAQVYLDVDTRQIQPITFDPVFIVAATPSGTRAGITLTLTH